MNKMIDVFLKAHHLDSKENYAEKCPARQELLAYCDDALDEAQSTWMMEHMAACPLCSEAILALQAFPELKEEIGSIDAASAWQKFARRAEPPTVTSSAPGLTQKKNLFCFDLRGFWSLARPKILAGAALLVLLILIPALYYLSRPRLADLASISRQEWAAAISQPLRGPANSPLDEGLEAFRDGDFPRARARLLSLVKTNPTDYEAHYYLGLSYLVEGERGFPGYRDRDKINEGIRYLQRAGELSPNPSFLADCYFYLAKAHMLNGDLTEARTYLRNILALAGSGEPLQRRKRQANEMLNKIDNSK